MRHILVLGAGRSSSSLIKYLLDHSKLNDWQITVGDFSAQAAYEKVKGHERGIAVRFDINDESSIHLIAAADVVISLLPAAMHTLVAVRCLKHNKHMLNASYVSEEMRALHSEALGKGLLFLNECGLDPGIDHMSAMRVIDRIRSQGGKLTSFESFTGGLIAPETDPENPWRYKFTWNPRNVVLAGQGTAKYLLEGKYKYTPYQQLFKRITPVGVPGFGEYEGYANRDSLKYIDVYKLDGIKTMLRGTLRSQGFCTSWNIFVQLGCCDDSYEMEGVEKMTHRSFIDSFLPGEKGNTTVQNLAREFKLPPDAKELQCLSWSGFFDDDPVGLEKGTPAHILEHILNKKWQLNPADTDQVVMWHRFVYELNGIEKEIQASLVATGMDSVYTAMAQTVGLPLAIAAEMLMQQKLSARGVVIPTSSEFYMPILAKLQLQGIVFKEAEI